MVAPPAAAAGPDRRPTGWPVLDSLTTGLVAMAHRGGATHPANAGRENTMRAFGHAVSLGYEFLETDVQVTSDGTVVTFHDDTLDRVTDGSGPLRHRTAADLAKTRVGGTEPIPTLAEVLETFPDVRINVDIKAPEAVRPLADLVDRTAAYDRVLVGAFDMRRLRVFRRLTAGRVATSASSVEVALLRLLRAGRPVRRWAGTALAAVQVPVRHRGIPVVTPSLVRGAHRCGLQVHVWTVDDPVEMQRLIDLGVDGIITDRTDVLKDVLVANDLWRRQE